MNPKTPQYLMGHSDIAVTLNVYAVLVAGVAVADNLHTALWSVAAYTVILCFPCLRQVLCQNLSGMRTKGGTTWQYLCRCQRICLGSRQRWH